MPQAQPREQCAPLHIVTPEAVRRSSEPVVCCPARLPVILPVGVTRSNSKCMSKANALINPQVPGTARAARAVCRHHENTSHIALRPNPGGPPP